MGLALYNALLRPAVRRVTVVERDADVITLFEAISLVPVHKRTFLAAYEGGGFGGCWRALVTFALK